MRVLVTGGAGFIGSHLVDRLVELGHEVRVIDNLSLGKRENVNPRAIFFGIDISNRWVLKNYRVFEGVDYVFHCAAMPRIQPSIQNPDESFSNNLLGTNNVLVAAKEAAVKGVIFSGSSSVYGDQRISPLVESLPPKPKNPYALHKLMGEELCRQFTDLYNLPTVCLRYFNVYGERQVTEGAYATVVGIFLRQKAKGEPLTIVGDGEQRRDFTYVHDVVSANISAMEHVSSLAGQVINIGTGENYSVNEIAGMINNIGPNTGTKQLPPRPGEARETLADISKAKKFLGYQPTISLRTWLDSRLRQAYP